MQTKVIDMVDLSFEEERDLMLEHIGKVIGIPHHIFPQTMSVSINPNLKKKYVTITCHQNAKTKENQVLSYSYELTLR